MKKVIALLLVFALLSFCFNSVSAQEIQSKGYVLIEATTGKVIFAGNEHEKLAMASTTKIMTALIALEQNDIDEYFEVDANAIKVEGTSMGLRQGDKVSLRVLAAGMLLPSGNDAANAAAVKIGGSLKGFADIMNKKAKSLNLKNTNFVTPSGLNHDDHYSTAYDMAILASYALQNQDFAEICSKIKLPVEFGNPPQKRTLVTHNRLLKEYDGCVGVKTGYTRKAGRCLVSAVTRDGVTLICVTLGASNDWQVHKSLYNKGFAEIEKTNIELDPKGISAHVVGGVSKKLNVVAHTTATAPISQQELKNIESVVCMQRFYYAPIKKDDVLGEVKHYFNGKQIATTTLLASKNVNQENQTGKKSFFQKIKEFFNK